MLSACYKTRRQDSEDYVDVERVEYASTTGRAVAPMAVPLAGHAGRAGAPQAARAGQPPSRAGPFACCTVPKACREQSLDGTINLDPVAPTQYPASGPAPAAAQPSKPPRGNSVDKAPSGYRALPDSDSEDDATKFINSLRRDVSGVNDDIRGLKNYLIALLALIGLLGVCLLYVAYGELSLEMQGKARHWTLLASIPSVACVVTWLHIWMAIRMMFLPLRFLGLWQYGDTGLGVGWQGVVPRKAHKMAKTSYKQARPYLDGPRDWLKRVDPKKLVSKIRPQLKQVMEDALHRAGTRHFHRTGQRALFEGTRVTLSEAAFVKVHENCGDLWEQFTDLLCDPDIGIDNDGMIVKVFTENKETLNRFFLTLGEQEFKFIESFGALLGFLCGLLQLFFYNRMDERGRAILLPATGFFLGIATNWIAIMMVFKPCFPHPVKVCGWHLFTIQGLFLKRQPEVCKLYAKMLCEHFLSFDKVVEYLGTMDELWGKLKAGYVEFSARTMHQTLGSTGSWLASGALGKAKFEEFEEDLKSELVQGLKNAHDLHKISGRYIGKESKIEENNCMALRRMPPDEFENLLHPVFQEDEWILILLGTVRKQQT
ncbi:unnamed protein product [Prorocentrum cordatum]|uniref:Uncharacterized protein n=1 Tax=Prorocentrum cordatum TaxID=2364126 RepID=A0ABN9PNE3_9DINO|nr:unnamed protein product [Polarella glacialis]